MIERQTRAASGLIAARAAAILLTSMAAACATPTQTSTRTARETTAPEQKYDAVIADVLKQSPYPTISVSIRQRGKVVYEKATGYADLENSVSATPDTVFQIGSVTKSFTSLAIAQLAAAGKVDLDAPVGSYVRSLKGPIASVPVRRLMDHTSGIVNYTELDEFPRGTRREFTREEMMKFFADKPLLFKPGEAFHYTNSGTFLLGVIIEEVSGLSYADYLRQNVFAPLGLTRTYYGDLAPIIPGRARGYVVTREGVANAPNLSPTIPFSAGALLSTVQDLQKYIDGVHHLKKFDSAITDILYTQQPLASGVKNQYALGALVIRDWLGHKKIAHAGDIDGFSAYIAYYPDDDLSIVVAANARNLATPPFAVEQKLARAVFGAPDPSPLADKAGLPPLDQWVGEYRVGPFQFGPDRVSIIKQDDLLVLVYGAGENAPKIPLLRTSESTFIAAHDSEMAFAFAVEDGKAVLHIDYYGGEFIFTRSLE